jgi:hypothetical protein
MGRLHRTTPLRATLGLAALALGLPALAHHSWAANYDLAQSKRIRGTVSRVVYQSPHSSLHIDVELPNGRTERWTAEWASPTRLRERGVSEITLRSGDYLTIDGNPHRNPAAKSLRIERLMRASDGFEYP